MRIVTWNCNLTLRHKLDALMELSPDVAIVQECEQAVDAPHGFTYLWYGANPLKGLGVLARDAGARIEPSPKDSWTFFLPVTLPTMNLRVLAAWAFNRRAKKLGVGRDGTLLPVIDNLAPWLSHDRSVVVGDLNNWAKWDTPRGTNNLNAIRGKLEHLGLLSAYHSMTGDSFGAEREMTHFFQKNLAKSYHIDYCFVHRSMQVLKATVPPFSEWRGRSDHVPLIVDLNVQLKR